jgi:anti-anti-sigma factor
VYPLGTTCGVGDDDCNVSGEVDIVNHHDFYDRLTSCVDETDGPIVRVDCSNVRFMDGAGLRRVQDAARYAGQRGRRLILVRPSPAVTRIVRAAGMTHLLETSYE